MRSSRSAPDPLDPGRNGFAHRGLHGPFPLVENGLTAFAAALEMGCGIECDLRLTADNQVIVFHDSDTHRVTGVKQSVGKSTLADLVDLRVGDQPIPTLASLLALVAGRVPVLLEAKVERDLWRFGPALVQALNGYRGPVGVMSFHAGLMRWLKTNAPHLRRGLVVKDSLGPLKRWFAMRIADPQFVAIESAALGKPWVDAARAARPVYSWTVKTAEQRRALSPLADALIWEADGRP